MMPKNVLGIVYSNSYDSSLGALTARRTMGSVPFGGRYRLIDFALSNLVNCGVTKVGVIANSNSSKDILIKEKIVSEISDLIFVDNKSIEEARKNINNSIPAIESKIEKVFESNKYDKDFKISYGLNKFPKKEYEGIEFVEGEYESLVIEIGEAKGNNYWCMLYPPLCFIDNSKEDNIEYKFKLIEALKKLF